MEHRAFQLRKSVLFRPVGDELIVVDTDSGKFFHFSLGTQAMLKFFQQGGSVSSYVEALDPESKEQEATYLSELCGKMEAFQILETIPDPVSGQAACLPSSYERPRFLREGESGLDDVAFLYP